MNGFKESSDLICMDVLAVTLQILCELLVATFLCCQHWGEHPWPYNVSYTYGILYLPPAVSLRSVLAAGVELESSAKHIKTERDTFINSPPPDSEIVNSLAQQGQRSFTFSLGFSNIGNSSKFTKLYRQTRAKGNNLVMRGSKEKVIACYMRNYFLLICDSLFLNRKFERAES